MKRRDEARRARQLDEALDGKRAGFDRERSLADAIPSAGARPPRPDADLVVVRAGLAVRRYRARRTARTAKLLLSGSAAAVVAVLVFVASLGGSAQPRNVQAAYQSLDALTASVNRLETAIAGGDRVQVAERIVEAQQSAHDAQVQVQSLPAPSRQIAVALTQQRVNDLDWLLNQTQESLDGKPSAVQVPSSSPAADIPPAQPTQTTAPSTTQSQPTPSTTTPATTSTTAPSTTTSTTVPSTTTSTTVPSTTTSTTLVVGARGTVQQP